MLEIFQYDFMLRAFAAGLMIAILAPAIGIFLVVKRYSLLADTLSHVSLVGVALSALVGINPMVGALITSSVAALGIEELRTRRKLFGESLLALVLSGSLALAIILFGFTRGQSANLLSILFGSITTVTSFDLWLIGVFGLAVLGIVLAGFKTFFLVAYDEELARANGVPVRLLNAVLVILAAITVSLSLRIVGTLLVGALMVIPVLTATQFKQSFSRTFRIALVISVLSVVIGLFTSFYFDLPSGGSIVLMSLVFFVSSLLWSRVRAADIK
jgi:zinc transport system permease protein